MDGRKWRSKAERNSGKSCHIWPVWISALILTDRGNLVGNPMNGLRWVTASGIFAYAGEPRYRGVEAPHADLPGFNNLNAWAEEMCLTWTGDSLAAE